ncbi:MAG TPA: hypothetical protein QGI59_04770, partial [Candidatus Poseidoniia archaeon]|nr:hypothetical protein [Candidatus Poseidoniia archaeon]
MGQRETNIFENIYESSNENQNSKENEEKEVVGDPSLRKGNKKKLLKEKYKIFTSKYDEIKNAEELEN